MDTFKQAYELNEVIGEGAFAKVKVATRIETGKKYAVKTVDKLQLMEQERVRLKYEIAILKTLNHPNIVRLFEVYESRSRINLVTELFEGCELFEEIVTHKHFRER